MRLSINGEPIPNVCKGLTQYTPDAEMRTFETSPIDHCAILLEHCKASDSPSECATRLISEATVHSVHDFPGEFYHTSINIIDGTQMALYKFQGGIDLWFKTAAVTKLEDRMVADTMTMFGYFVDSLIR